VNQVIQQQAEGDVPEFVRNRMSMQETYLDRIGDEFPSMVRAVLPLYDDEIRGTASLERASADLFA
jgi:hypothetical protein